MLGWGTATAAPAGLFEVYENNRIQAIPNYITVDLILLAYSLIRDDTLTQTEQNRLLPLLQILIQGLREKNTEDDAIGKANQDFLAVLDALLQGADQPLRPADPERAGAELKLVLEAKEPAPSPLWGMKIDYSQFQPRGHYTRSAPLERYFRVQRYAGTVLFAVKESQATGLSRELADRQTGQALRLAQSLQEPALKSVYEKLEGELAWAFGPSEDLRSEELLAVAKDHQELPALRQALLEFARSHDRQPRILAGIVDKSKLEEGITPRDVLTGWRLLPLRYSPEAAAFQHLVYDSVGVYQEDCPDCPPPFSLAVIDGKKVKGFPSAYELMALLGSRLARECLEQGRDTHYQGYTAAWQAAARELDRAEGLKAAELQLLQTGFSDAPKDIDPARRLTTLLGFWTWQRYLSVLYSKQSYTVSGKSLNVPKERSGAWLEPAQGLYLALARVVEGHRAHALQPVWERFAGVLDRLAAISGHEVQGMPLSADEVAYLNELDRTLLELTRASDRPIVVDVHTNPASSEVLEQAVGYAEVTEKALPDGQKARGALFTHYEFKQPLTERLTDEAWRKRLETAEGKELPSLHVCPARPQKTATDKQATAEPTQPAATGTPELHQAPSGPSPQFSLPAKDPKLIPRTAAEEKLDAALIGLVHARAEGCDKAVKDYADRAGLTLEDGRLRVQIITTSKAAVTKLKKRVRAAGGKLITELENNLFVWMPVDSIAKFAALEEVWTLSVPQNIYGPQTGKPEAGIAQPPPVKGK
jgi:hypothetical protein